MCRIYLILLSILLTVPSAYADIGLISIKSSHGVAETADRLESVLKEKGMTVFARIDHSEGARKVQLDLPDTVLVIFGNPKVGTPLMKCNRSVAISVPIRCSQPPGA